MTKQQLIEDNMNLVYSFLSKEYPTFLYDEDIVQCGMLGLCRAANTWDENISKFSTYAWKCIRTEVVDEFRKRAKHNGVLSLDYEKTDKNGDTTTFGSTLIGEEDVNYVDLSFNTDLLTDKQKQVFELYKTGLSVPEIAKKIGISKQHAWETMRKIRKLRGYYYEY